MPKLLLTVSATLLSFAMHGSAFAVDATKDLLTGLWMETANYPSSSIIRFERDGPRLVGKYRQVSMPQRHMGFKIGETVMRGTVQGNLFRARCF
jgi:hypothetical protein